jgi:hypothetical protein
MVGKKGHKPWGQVSRGRSGTLQIHWEQFSPDWTEEELTIAWAVCPRPGQGYNKDQPEVRDVASLIGRTPSAVSRKFGNLHSAWRPGTGLEHGSKLDKVVVDRYRGSEDTDLIRDASRLRENWWEKCPSVRGEGIFESETEREAVIAAVQRVFKQAEVDPKASLTYKREGSHIAGFDVAAWWILVNWDRVPDLIENFLSVIKKLRGSLGFEHARARRREAYAEDKIRNTLVGFHFSEFGRAGLVDLAIFDLIGKNGAFLPPRRDVGHRWAVEIHMPPLAHPQKAKLGEVRSAPVLGSWGESSSSDCYDRRCDTIRAQQWKLCGRAIHPRPDAAGRAWPGPDEYARGGAFPTGIDR